MRRACTLTVGRGGGGAWQLEHAQCVPAERELQAWLCGGGGQGVGMRSACPPRASRRPSGGWVAGSRNACPRSKGTGVRARGSGASARLGGQFFALRGRLGFAKGPVYVNFVYQTVTMGWRRATLLNIGFLA